VEEREEELEEEARDRCAAPKVGGESPLSASTPAIAVAAADASRSSSSASPASEFSKSKEVLELRRCPRVCSGSSALDMLCKPSSRGLHSFPIQLNRINRLSS
jgi:hypothetical protein